MPLENLYNQTKLIQRFQKNYHHGMDNPMPKSETMKLEKFGCTTKPKSF